MASRRHPLTMENLPGEVLSDIFIRLLAKQLAQMRSVCKSWNALLSDSSFVKSHLSRSILNDDGILLFFYHRFSFDHCPFTTHSSRSPNHELTNFVKLPLKTPSKYREGRIIGSVNGLICFSYGPPHDDFVFHIWKPSLSAMLTLPPCSFPSQKSSEIFHLRFGYDPKTDDYKVVKLTSLVEPLSMLPEVEVYSMRKGSWELITQSFPSHIITWIEDHDTVCADGHDGHLHWLGYTNLKSKTQTNVAFDLGEETFSQIPFPNSLQYPHGSWIYYFGVLGGKLCAMSRVVKDGEWEVWVMNEYGVPESWVKHHVFCHFSGDIFPYGFTSHSDFLYRYEDNIDHIGLYDPTADKTKTFKIIIGKIVEYIDSLVWIEPGRLAG